MSELADAVHRAGASTTISDHDSETGLSDRDITAKLAAYVEASEALTTLDTSEFSDTAANQALLDAYDAAAANLLAALKGEEAQ
jgi:hypothetical protein